VPASAATPRATELNNRGYSRRELRRRLSAEQSIPRFEPCLPRGASEPPARAQLELALTMKTFVLIVTFAATTDLIGGARTERIASFDDYQSCVSAGQTLYPDQHWECVPQDDLQ